MDRSGKIKLAHGSGGALMHELIDELIVARLANPILSGMDDAAELPDIIADARPGDRLALTTDSYVVQPLFFPGGDIGKLSVCGTVNDLAMKGARPAYLTLGLVIEEGFAVADLARVLDSVAETAETAGVSVVAGDTKVVERGGMGGLIINTAGVGLIPAGVSVSGDRARPGDVVVVSGTIGDHETAILVAREGLEPRADDRERLRAAERAGRRRARRGARRARDARPDAWRPGHHAERDRIPFGRAHHRRRVEAPDERQSALGVRHPRVRPHLHGERGQDDRRGAAAASVGSVLNAMRTHPLGADAAVIGSIGDGAGVSLRTVVGGERPIVMLEGVQLPRIC